MDFATKLRVIRIMLNWRQSQMAEAFGVTKETISLWETGHREPRQFIQRMLNILAERNGIIINERGYPEYAERKSSEPSPERG